MPFENDNWIVIKFLFFFFMWFLQFFSGCSYEGLALSFWDAVLNIGMYVFCSLKSCSLDHYSIDILTKLNIDHPPRHCKNLRKKYWDRTTIAYKLTNQDKDLFIHFYTIKNAPMKGIIASIFFIFFFLYYHLN